MPQPDADVRAMLPLKPARFHILLALGDEAQHGYGIRARVESESNGRIRLWPATLYGTIRSLSEDGLIQAADPGTTLDADARRQYYELTPRGRDVLRAEADRLQALVRSARATRALS